jgi:hypothetical protein
VPQAASPWEDVEPGPSASMTAEQPAKEIP